MASRAVADGTIERSEADELTVADLPPDARSARRRTGSVSSRADRRRVLCVRHVRWAPGACGARIDSTSIELTFSDPEEDIDALH